jgi:hypothetical protein
MCSSDCSQESSPCDASYRTVRWNTRAPQDTSPDSTLSSESWNVYTKHLPSINFGVTIGDLRPSTGTDSAVITILPLITQISTREDFRVTAPAGYRWAFDFEEFVYRISGLGELVEADLPLSVTPSPPIVEPFNQLLVAYLASDVMAGVRYGFRARIRVPSIAPTSSSNIFVIEFGFGRSDLRSRTEAGSTPAPLVHALINGLVGYRTSLAGFGDNELCFRIETITKIPKGGALVIEGPTFLPHTSTPSLSRPIWF